MANMAEQKLTEKLKAAEAMSKELAETVEALAYKAVDRGTQRFALAALARYKAKVKS